MDSYSIYTIRIKALNQARASSKTRICRFDIFKDEKDVTEAEWRDYFLSARVPNNTAYKTLDKEVKLLCMNTSRLDAESHFSRLMAEFYEIVNRLNMEDVIQMEPKKVVSCLVDALRPPAFKAAVKDQLGRQAHKPTKSNIQLLLKWLRKELERFMKFEAQIATQHPCHFPKSARHKLRSANRRRFMVEQIVVPNRIKSSKPRESSCRDQGVLSKQDKQIRKCFKCGDQTHGCPDITSPSEAKEFYEKSTGRKVVKTVMSIVSNISTKNVPPSAMPCTVMDVVETSITSDSAADEPLEKLLKALSGRELWINYLEVANYAAVTGIGDKPVTLKNKVKTEGVGELLLSKWVMQKLGYSSDNLLAEAQQAKQDWDMGDVDDGPPNKVARVLAFVMTIEGQQRSAEEIVLEDDENPKNVSQILRLTLMLNVTK
ncbi:LOW QUALITY PROTEIN: hypothetical protein PHMEG_00017149 [Phytophthora megakarya]|uniref:Uncharacterized protein n=1 Tax=Phytophthora megakarya TaxID=4795 RepID=A0A225VYS5_9STRA|nr:LOW QUALITY PROTEIN: hypothetical protein PHMEG_00017149 [Phytophthora megakarya]